MEAANFPSYFQMFIRIRKRLSFLEVCLASIAGVVGGTYIWLPVFQENAKKKLQANTENASKTNETTKTT